MENRRGGDWEVHNGNRVRFKGDNHGVTIFIDDRVDFQQVKEELTRRFHKNASFFRSGSVRFHLGKRTLRDQDKEDLLSLFQNKDQVLVIEFLEGIREKRFQRDPLSPQGKNCSIIEGTIRSGQKIHLEESLLINGDVNPGAEIVSNGNIYVLGSLRGMAHAGASGDEKAYVYALFFQPTQLRIANLIVRSPDETVQDFRPEIARIKEGTIVVEPFNI